MLIPEYNRTRLGPSWQTTDITGGMNRTRCEDKLDYQPFIVLVGEELDLDNHLSTLNRVAPFRNQKISLRRTILRKREIPIQVFLLIGSDSS